MVVVQAEEPDRAIAVARVVALFPEEVVQDRRAKVVGVPERSFARRIFVNTALTRGLVVPLDTSADPNCLALRLAQYPPPSMIWRLRARMSRPGAFA